MHGSHYRRLETLRPPILRRSLKDLVARIALGEVGLIVSIVVTRLARNCSDWYPLLDICGHRGCLIADRDTVYDPGLPGGRLLLGLKGTISEVELHTIRGRLTAGLLNKARRGELALQLPAGLVRDLAWCTDRAVGGAEALGDVGDRPPQLRMPILPFKLNQDCHHHIPCQQHKVTNWPGTAARLGVVTSPGTESESRAWTTHRATGLTISATSPIRA